MSFSEPFKGHPRRETAALITVVALTIAWAMIAPSLFVSGVWH